MAELLATSEAEQIARLRLIRSDNIGPVTFRHLLARFGDARRALEALPDLTRRGGGRPPRIATAAEAEAELRAIAAFGAEPLFWGLAPYPRLLSEIDDAPPVLAAKGRFELLHRPAVAMVGARNASAAAIRFARGMACDLAGEGFAVVSGLARGIDSAVHAGALDGGTIAVVAGGLDIVYPPENRDLFERICADGLVVAEQPIGVEPQARHFPRRNRIISGLSLGTVIVEAAPRSGSLITARFAGEQGREVMAVPGSPLDPRAQGCNLLIRDGATLVQCAADVVESIRPSTFGSVAPSADRLFDQPVAADVDDGDRSAILRLLGPVPVPIDELVRLTGLPPAAVQTVLLELELAGRLVRHAGARVALSY
jgi:DNA processing protein